MGANIMFAGLYDRGAVISEYSLESNPTVVRDFARAIAAGKVDPAVSYQMDRFTGHSRIRADGTVLVVVAEAAVPRRQSLAVLQKLENELGSAAEPAKVLRDVLANFDSHDPLVAAQQDLQSVRSVMLKNVDRILERGERVSLLVDRTDHINTSGDMFRRQATRVRSKFWWRNVRMVVLLVLVALLMICLTKFLLY